MSARRSLADRPPRRLLSTRPRLSADDPVPGPALPRAPVPQRLPAIPPAAPGAEPARCPDLLNLVPAHTVEHGKLVRALTFSFVAGNDSGAVAHAFDAAPIAASTFEPECFFDELYVEDLLRGCMSPPRPPKAGPLHERYLMRLLSQPPADPPCAHCGPRSGASSPRKQPVRAAVDALFTRLSELFSLFSGDDQVSLRGEQTRRRIEILRVVADVLRAMQAPALAAATSCLHRTAHYAAQVCATPAYQHLEELLRYENERAYADLTLQLGSDGRVRGLRVVGVREDTRNRYHVSLAQQWLGRIGLWFRGFRVDDGEIIDRWLDQVFDEIVEHLPPLVQLYGDLEWYLAGQAFRDACLARGLPVCLPEWTPAEAHAPCRVERRSTTPCCSRWAWCPCPATWRSAPGARPR
jgi:hypothetical protein